MILKYHLQEKWKELTSKDFLVFNIELVQSRGKED
jgi:hypothetical protein